MLSKLLNIGNSNQLDFEEEIKVRLLNAFSLVFMSVLIFFVTLNILITKQYQLAIVELSCFFVVPIIIWFQHKKKYSIARVLFFVILHSIIFYASVFSNPGMRIEYFYLIIIMFLMILVRNIYWTFILISLDIVLFFIPQVIFKSYPEASFPYANSIGLTFATVLSLRFFIIIQQWYRAKLNFQKEKLEDLNREKNDLMSIVAHDLKTPLAQIKGLVSILELEGSQLNKDQVNLIKKIKGVTENQHQQITTFLDVNALDEKVEEIIIEDFDVIESIKNLIEEMSTLTKSKSIQIISNYDHNKIIVHGSKEGWIKIVSNLLSNAIKYSHTNSIINIDIKSDARQILILIKDQGQGFKKEDLPNVFIKNKVLSATPTGDETASGIGLYIVKKYVDLMNGWVWLESEFGKGTTFFVKLPRYQ